VNIINCIDIFEVKSSHGYASVIEVHFLDGEELLPLYIVVQNVLVIYLN